ncbi:hypothetical protein, partial [Salmonella enterica]|uniref:hypothetical protein n=1 Tax=Salmonella enterica TaxID=28901 RepID=UPI0021B3A1DE
FECQVPIQFFDHLLPKLFIGIHKKAPEFFKSLNQPKRIRLRCFSAGRKVPILGAGAVIQARFFGARPAKAARPPAVRHCPDT